jgi:hypothetical protein
MRFAIPQRVQESTRFLAISRGLPNLATYRFLKKQKVSCGGRFVPSCCRSWKELTPSTADARFNRALDRWFVGETFSQVADEALAKYLQVSRSGGYLSAERAQPTLATFHCITFSVR